MMLGACQRLGLLQGPRCATTSPGPDGHTHRVCLGSPSLGAPSMGADAVDLGPTGLLIDAEGNPIADTRSRLDLALR